MTLKFSTSLIYFWSSLLSFLVSLSRSFSTSLTAYSALITFEWVVNSWSCNLLYSSSDRCSAWLIALSWLAMITHFYFSSPYACIALVCQSLIFNCSFNNSCCPCWTLSSWEVSSWRRTDYNYNRYLPSFSLSIVRSLLSYSFWPFMMNFWSRIIS